MTKYWVVGAKWDSTDINKDIYLSRGYWYLPKGDNDNNVNTLHAEIQIGDKIAIKEHNKENGIVKLKAVGIVKEVHSQKKIIKIDWILEEVKRETVGQGIFTSVEGPFEEKDDWVKKVLDSI